LGLPARPHPVMRGLPLHRFPSNSLAWSRRCLSRASSVVRSRERQNRIIRVGASIRDGEVSGLGARCYHRFVWQGAQLALHSSLNPLFCSAMAVLRPNPVSWAISGAAV